VRRLVSSFHALKQTLNKRLKDERLALTDEDLSQDEQAEEVMDVEDAYRAVQEGLVVEERASILGLLRKIAKLGTDTKVKRVKAEIEDVFAAGYHSAIVFTQYTDTMDYLRIYLAVELPDVPIACYSGRGGEVRDQGGYWNPCSKEAIKKKLKDGAIRLLICTDAAAEGLNFQTCGVVINLDLPWNPMKVEQRIGRVDRIGQKYPVIRVVNFAYEDTVEADVYFALGRRINLF
jgi:superfamily II DNA/RNA helicase